ncbi:MAG: alpha-ketoglutarate-dependent dioxygenase AlkB [Nocardioidaceae bacterium]
MSVDFQTSLFDLGAGRPAPGPLAGTVTRHRLGRGAWVDVRPGWLSGSDEVFARLVTDVPWQAERRQMWDSVVDVPRLLKFYGEGEALPDPSLVEAREALNAYYAAELGEEFVTAGMCFYRDGRDSVAWHGDTIGRSRTEDTMVAIVSVGEARRLSLRPRNGGEQARAFPLGHGDLIVMGGSCQRTWEHAILKTARAVGPRISIQYRPRGVR